MVFENEDEVLFRMRTITEWEMLKGGKVRIVRSFNIPASKTCFKQKKKLKMKNVEETGRVVL